MNGTLGGERNRAGLFKKATTRRLVVVFLF
jgi:hypothetical protein